MACSASLHSLTPNTDVFPGIRAMEAQVVSMVLGMYNAGADGAGTTTVGYQTNVTSLGSSIKSSLVAQNPFSSPVSHTGTGHAKCVASATLKCRCRLCHLDIPKLTPSRIVPETAHAAFSKVGRLADITFI